MQALEIAEVADAYYLLALNEAESLEEAGAHLQKAIELSSAALKRLAADYFEKNTGTCAA